MGLRVGPGSLKLQFIKARLLHKLKRAFVALVLATFTQQNCLLSSLMPVTLTFHQKHF